MNPQMHYDRSGGDQEKDQTIPSHVNPDPSILMEGVSNINLRQRHHGFMAHQMNFCTSTSSNVYYPFVAPLAAPRLPAVPINYGSPDPLLSSYNNVPVFGGSSEELARNHLKQSTGSCSKRKNAQNSVGSSHCSAYESTSASVNAPIDTGHVYYGHPPHYGGGNGFLSIASDSNDRSVRVRSGAAGINLIQPSNYNGFMGGSHGAQSLQPASAFPFDQTIVGNPTLVGCLAWNHSPAIPYMHAGNINRVPLEVSMGMAGSAEIDREARTMGFPHLVHASHGDHNLHQLPQTQGMRNHAFQFRPQVPAPHFPLPSGAINIPMSSPVGPRPRGSFRQVRIGTNQPQTRGIPETLRIHCDIPYLRYIDEVAIIDLPEHHTDHHSDMRMDIEHMSYEELLALGERIGNVNTGLSEESITNQLRTRRYELPFSTSADAKESHSPDGDTAGCIICLGNYQDQEELGCLNCGHDYHADCLKKWMLVKNVCPICKTQALPS